MAKNRCTGWRAGSGSYYYQNCDSPRSLSRCFIWREGSFKDGKVRARMQCRRESNKTFRVERQQSWQNTENRLTIRELKKLGNAWLKGVGK